MVEGQAGWLACCQEASPAGYEEQLVDEVAGVVLSRHLDDGLALEEGNAHTVGAVVSDHRSPGEAILQLKSERVVSVVRSEADMSFSSLLERFKSSLRNVLQFADLNQFS